MTQATFEKKVTDLNESIMDVNLSTPSKSHNSHALAVSSKMSPMKGGDASAYANVSLTNGQDAGTLASAKSQNASSNPSLPLFPPMSASAAPTAAMNHASTPVMALPSSPVKIPYSRSQDLSRQEERCPLYIEKASPITSTRERTLNLYQSHQEQAHSLIL